MKQYGTFVHVCLFIGLAALLVSCSDEAGTSSGTGTCEGAGCETTQRDRTASSTDAGDGDATNSDSTNAGDSSNPTENPDTTASSPDRSETPCGVGRVEGRVCAPDEQTWLGGADVFVSGTNCEGVPFTLTEISDTDGYFTIHDVPAGFHQLRVAMGSFEANYAIQINDGEISDFTAGQEKLCLSADELDIAVIDGEFDAIDRILTNLAIEHTLFTDEGDNSAAESLLLDSDRLDDFDILFINCGQQNLNFGWAENDPGAYHQRLADNLATFVERGGSLYVSDWAHFLVERAFPEAIRFSSDESNYEAAFRGAMGEFTASIVDSRLRTAVGSDQVVIDFPLQGWVVPEAVGSGSNVMVQGDIRLIGGDVVNDLPLLVSFKPDSTSGTVLFTSFHNESQITDAIERILQFVVFSL